MTRTKAATALAFVLALWLLFAPDIEVLAHAGLLRSDPAPGAVLTQPPGRVSLWFTEPLDGRFSEVQVMDSRGNRVDNGDSSVSRDDPTMLSATLQSIPDGTYTVLWRVLSSVDAHPERGSYSFSVGAAAATGAPPAAAASPLFLSPLEPVTRWLALLGLLAVVGGLGFELLVARPVMLGRKAAKSARKAGEQLSRRMARVIWTGLGLFSLASVAQLLVQASVLHQIPLDQALGAPAASVLADTGWGRVWLWRMSLAVAVAVALGTGLAVRSWRREGGRSAGQVVRVLSLVLGAGALLTMSLTSHGAAAAGIRTPATISDFLHLLAAAFWVGGLFHLALAVPFILGRLSGEERRAVLASMVPRFSAIAAPAAGILIITGAYAEWAQVGSLSGMGTPYGLTLLAKIMLVTPLLLLGGFSLVWTRPRLAQESGVSTWLRRLVVGEAVLAVLVLLSVGFLTSMQPGRHAVLQPEAVQETAVSPHDTVEVEEARGQHP